MESIIVLHHHEITLKGDNRQFFERHLMNNVRKALSGIISPSAVTGGYGRFVLNLSSQNNIEPLTERLSCVFGLANICVGVRVEQSIDAFCKAAEHLLAGQNFKTIRVHTHRPDKKFPIGSMAVNAQVGEFLCKRFNVRADLTNPDVTIFIEIADKVAYVYCSKLKGAGGLPTGVSGKIVALLSAGFDSPVASWQMMKRGAVVIFVHFHSMPYTSQHSVDQVRQLVENLTRFQFVSKLYLVPFADLQNEIVLHTPQPLRVILYRRMMVRIAESVLRKENAEGLVTGEAIGQVASQTLRNIRVIDAVATVPIFRPLSGTDKEETMALARKIGTYEISKEPYDDCCSFLAPRKPETWASSNEVEEAESKLNIADLLQLAEGKITVEHFSYPK